jgi:hypothetical protein
MDSGEGPVHFLAHLVEAGKLEIDCGDAREFRGGFEGQGWVSSPWKKWFFLVFLNGDLHKCVREELIK